MHTRATVQDLPSEPLPRQKRVQQQQRNQQHSQGAFDQSGYWLYSSLRLSRKQQMENSIEFNVSHVGLGAEDPRAAALHLQRYFGFTLKDHEEGIDRFILISGNCMLELSKGSPGGHLGFQFANYGEAFGYLMANIPSEIIFDHENVVKRARSLRPGKNSRKQKPAGLIRFKTKSGLSLEFHWGDTVQAHDS